MINIGQLNRRISYNLPGTSTPDGYGGYVVNAGLVVNTWCSASPISVNESLLYGLAIGSSAYKFRFYYEQGKNIAQGTNLVYEGRSFRVRSIMEIDEDKQVIEIMAFENI